jgi:hypothetical protein
MVIIGKEEEYRSITITTANGQVVVSEDDDEVKITFEGILVWKSSGKKEDFCSYCGNKKNSGPCQRLHP